jgi:hypothetical protein
VDRGRAARSRKPDSGHTGTISITIRVRRVSMNAMKPRIQCVLTQWKPGFIASGSVQRLAAGRELAGQVDRDLGY